MYETEKSIERVVLMAVEEKSGNSAVSAEELLEELAMLARTSGAEVCDSIIQKRESVDSAHYFGKGKLEELKSLISLHNATGVIADDELTSAQIRNMENILDTKVMDRTMVILDIFAGRAVTAEGKVQVELAQQKYRLTHLSGIGKNLSRLGGGIGTRGPGEKKLETDRRHIRSRIDELNSQLKDIETQRAVLRERREKNSIPVVSMVGYTNAGKSTLMNLLTNAGVLAEDKLFATLDTTTRKVSIPNGSDILMSDTVGFIRKLPHHLIQAFRATLEELNHADILLHVVDASSPQRDNQMEVVYNTLSDLKCIDKPIVTVFNKTDLPVLRPLPSDKHAACCVSISAATGENTDVLLTELGNVLKSLRTFIKVLIPYGDGKQLSLIHDNCEIIKEEHSENGTLIEAYGNNEISEKLNKYKP